MYKETWFDDGSVRLSAVCPDNNYLVFQVYPEDACTDDIKGPGYFHQLFHRFIIGGRLVLVWSTTSARKPTYRKHTFVVGNRFVTFEMDDRFDPIVFNELYALKTDKPITTHNQVWSNKTDAGLLYSIWVEPLVINQQMKFAPIPFNF